MQNYKRMSITLDGLPTFKLPTKGLETFLESDDDSDSEYVDKLKSAGDPICQTCSIKMQRKSSQYCICPSCGMELECEIIDSEQYSGDLTHSYNATDESYVSFKVTGACKSVHAQNVKLMGTTSDYNNIRTRRVLQKINAWLYQIDGDSIPSNVCRDTAETYSRLQESENLVKRAGGLNGVLASLLYNKCIEHGIPKPKVIATITGIQDNQLSEGDKILRQLANKEHLIFQKDMGVYRFY